MAVGLPGLSSGIDTTSLISQLMAVASQPENAVKAQLTVAQNKVNEYTALQTKFKALQTAADALSDPAAFNAAKASSSSTAVAATASTSAQIGVATTFSVTKLATAQISTLAVPVGGSVLSTPANGFDIVDGAGATHHLTPTDGTAASVASAINGAGLGVKAAVITTDTGQVLQFTSTSSGTAGSFSVNGLDSAPQTLVAAQNAQLTVGDPLAGGYTVSSSTNTFANAIPGVTLTVNALASNVTVSVASDTDSIGGKMKALVDSANAVLNELRTTTAKGGTLEANATVNALVQNVLNVVSHGTTGASFATVGVQLNKDGALTFDQAAFNTNYAANAANVATISKALGTGMSSVGFNASSTTLGGLVTSGNNRIRNLNDEIARWDKRLATQQEMLQKKYSAMETVLNKLSSQSAWLTSTLTAITNSNSKN